MHENATETKYYIDPKLKNYGRKYTIGYAFICKLNVFLTFNIEYILTRQCHSDI